jgi:hypothetical protein
MKTFLIAFCAIVVTGCTAQRETVPMNWEAVCDKWSEQGYDALTEPEQVWISTRAFIDGVNDGGLVSYFFNYYADYYDDTTFALGELEAFEALDILESFAAFFGDDVPYDIDERNKIIDSWEEGGPEKKASESVDAVLIPLLDPLEKQLNAYLIEHGLDPDYGF